MSITPLHCPFCGESYPPGRNDAEPAWVAWEALDRIRQVKADGSPVYSAGAMLEFAEDALARPIPKKGEK